MKKSLLAIMMASLMLVTIFSAVSINAQRSAKRDTDVVIINANNGVTTTHPCDSLKRLAEASEARAEAAFQNYIDILYEKKQKNDGEADYHMNQVIYHWEQAKRFFDLYKECLEDFPTGSASSGQLSTVLE